MTPLSRSLLVASLLVGLPAIVDAQTPAAAPAAGATLSPADKDFAAFQAMLKPNPPANAKEMGVEALQRWMDESQRSILKAGAAFFETYPTDPRRWDVVTSLASVNPRFIQSIGPERDAKGGPVVVIDTAAKDAWKAKFEGMRQQMAVASDVPAGPRETMDWGAFAKDFRAASQDLKDGKPVDWASFRPRFDAHVAKYLQLDTATRRADDYLGALERNVPGASEAEWAHLKATTPSEALRAHASAQIERIELLRKPVDLAFTAVDGRAVDMQKLRGKVVLVDFWATWCGPCIAELPNVKSVYAKYHDQGFEIVGISLDRATDRQKLLDFVAKEEMPWPQHYDGKYWQNEYAVKYGIRGIPAMFLIDQNGRIVSTSARGPQLELEVKRLLAAAPAKP